jgi:hypothetical protein
LLPHAHDRSCEAAHRCGDEDDVVAMADGVDDGICVRGPAGCVVLGRQPDCDRVLPAGREFRNEPMPLPRVAATTRNEV